MEYTFFKFFKLHPFVVFNFIGCWVILVTIILLIIMVSRSKRKAEEEKRKQLASFLSKISHDIRTPLNAIINYTYMANTYSSDKEKVEEYLKKIDISSNQLMEFFDDILQMSRIESGKLLLNNNEESLLDIIDNNKTICESIAMVKDIQLTYTVSDLISDKIICDRLKFNQILLNVIGNALKYTLEKGTVDVSVSQKNTKNKDIILNTFTIKDTGIGIGEQYIKNIFEPFSRENNEKVYNTKGTGLGMYITKKIVDAMEGEIDIKSSPGTGTSVIITIETHKGSL